MPGMRGRGSVGDMGETTGLHQITRAVSDGTGLSEEEIWLLAAAAASFAAVISLVRAVDAVKDAMPGSRGRGRGRGRDRGRG